METTLVHNASAPGGAVRFDRDILSPFADRVTRFHLSVHDGQGNRIATPVQLAEMLAGNDEGKRKNAISFLNRLSAQMGDQLVRLSAAGLFPSTQTQGIPTAYGFTDTESQAVDTRWATLFQVQDYRASSTPYFKIVDVYNAVEFKVYLQGERIQIRHVQGSQEIYEAEIVAGGLQWNQFWAEFQNFVTVAQMVAGMYVRYGVKMAKTAYEVLTASGAATITYDATGSNQLEKDINTINAGIVKIRGDIYGADGADGQTTEEDVSGQGLALLYNSNEAGVESRVRRALQASLETTQDANSVGYVTAPVVPIGTPFVTAGKLGYLVLPGRKNVAAVFRDLRIYDLLDARIAGVAEGRVGQGAYKFVRGDARQVVALNKS